MIMNNVILMGRLTRNPELKYTGTNRAVVNFSIAVDKDLSREKRQEMESKNQPTADFINIVAWDRLAENINKFTEKGKRVLVTGRIQTGSYDDKDGKRVYTTDVYANNIEFIEWKDNNANIPSSANTRYTQKPANNEPEPEFDFGADFDPTNDDGRIPF